MNPSERIRAALSRPEGGRPAGDPAVLEPAEGAPRSRPLIEVSEEVLAALSGHAGTAEPPANEGDVETTLPLIGAGEPKRVERAAATARLATPAAPERKTAPQKPRPGARAEEKAKRPGWVLPAGAGAAAAAALCLFLVLRPHPAPNSRENATGTAAAQAALQLKVDAAGNGLMGVRWNAESASVMQAREGRLIVTAPGQQPRTVALDYQQLRGGHMDYPSSAERLEFRLEVDGRSGGMEKESVIAFPPAAAAVPPTAAKAQSAAAATVNAGQAKSKRGWRGTAGDGESARCRAGAASRA